jgi:hypothetical protein
MNVLLVSPVPSHPQSQGNTSRVYQLGRMLQILGATVHFVYVQIEGLTETMCEAMRMCWDRFDTVRLTKEFEAQRSGALPAGRLV